MKYRTAAAFRTALETRLKAEQRDGVGISRLRKRVVFERLLARLQAVAPDAWVLKGGFALELRLGGSARTTKDIDIDWKVDEQEAVELLLDAAAMRLEDLFEFSLARSRMDDDLLGGGQRWTVTATLAGADTVPGDPHASRGAKLATRQRRPFGAASGALAVPAFTPCRALPRRAMPGALVAWSRLRRAGRGWLRRLPVRR